MFGACGEYRRNQDKTKPIQHNQTMKLTLRNSLQASACRLLAVSTALGARGYSKPAADQVRVFNEKVSGVPAANPVVISPNNLSPEFTAGLVAQGVDVLENPSGVITTFGNLDDGTP